MARMCVCMLIAGLCVKYAKTTCDPETVQKIKKLREGEEDSNILDSLLGELNFRYVEFGSNTEVLKSQCLSAIFTKTDKGYNVIYKGAASGSYAIFYKDGVIAALDQHGVQKWSNYVVLYQEGAVTLYACSTNDPSTMFAFSGVAVRTSLLSSSDDAIEKGKAALAKIGITGGVTPPVC